MGYRRLASVGFVVSALACSGPDPAWATDRSVEGALPHKTDFLTNPDCGRGTTFYPNAGAADRARCRNGIKSRGYTHLYLSIVSERHDFYPNPDGFVALLKELVDDGIKPVVWLTSDTGAWKDQPTASIMADLARFVPRIDALVSSYVLGLELGEYWTASEAAAIGEYLRSLTTKPIAAHQNSGQWDLCHQSWCDYMILQYANRTETGIKETTIRALDELGKPVVAGEYSLDKPESVSIARGNAGVAAGASGFGNGGTGGPGTAPPPASSGIIMDSARALYRLLLSPGPRQERPAPAP